MILYEDPVKIELDDSQLLVNNALHSAKVRTVKDMQEVLIDRSTAKNPEQTAYLMYRNVYGAQDLRYDITIIPQIMYGNEYAKTFGHYHTMAEKGLSYPEIYQVIKGNAAFILQKINHDQSVAATVIKATPGQIVLIPSNYGHASINISEDDLILANLVSSKFESEYGQYKKSQGAVVYYTTDGVIRNTNYLVRGVKNVDVDEINSKYGFICKDLLKEFYNFPQKFEFLNKPSLMFRAED